MENPFSSLTPPLVALMNKHTTAEGKNVSGVVVERVSGGHPLTPTHTPLTLSRERARDIVVTVFPWTILIIIILIMLIL